MQNVKGTYLATEYRKGLQLIAVSMSFPVQKKIETTMSCDAFRAPFHRIDTTIPGGAYVFYILFRLNTKSSSLY